MRERQISHYTLLLSSGLQVETVALLAQDILMVLFHPYSFYFFPLAICNDHKFGI